MRMYKSTLDTPEQHTQKLFILFDELLEKGKKEIHWSLLDEIEQMLIDADIEYITDICHSSEYTQFTITYLP